MNNLLPRPLIRARVGGRTGGNAALTAEGQAALATLRHVQAEIELAMERLRHRLAGEAAIHPDIEPWSLIMRTSARNALRGRVKAIEPGAVNSEVILDIGQGLQIAAIITRRSVEDLGLEVGAPATALIKSSQVILAAGDAPLRVSARNRLAGTVLSVEEGAVSSEVTLELADGKTLTATLTRHSVEDLGLAPGARATALIKASSVILAVE
jgi:molybdate transport system regulatory protein